MRAPRMDGVTILPTPIPTKRTVLILTLPPVCFSVHDSIDANTDEIPKPMPAAQTHKTESLTVINAAKIALNTMQIDQSISSKVVGWSFLMIKIPRALPKVKVPTKTNVTAAP